MVNLKGRCFLTLKDYSKEEIEYLVDLAIDLKNKKKNGIFERHLEHKNIALIFEKPSTRTRCSFTIGCIDEGAHPEYLGIDDIQLGHKETVQDTARVLGRFFDGIEFRGFSQKTVEALAEYSGVPVWNGLTDEDHPTQILADFMTIKEHFGTLENKKLVYLGDGRNNMANALMIGCSKMGIDFTIGSPAYLSPTQEIIDTCAEFAKESGSKIEITEDPYEAVKGADIIYTDVWVSMGEEAKSAERMAILRPYQVNDDIMAATGKDTTIFLHCLPAVRGNEVTNEVIEGPQSLVFDEAENRMHTIKAVMVATAGN
ncbi:MAG: ornithine carbamoyltransferase [Firmicutes bacterium]|nr:ornithine carbamoyltransferase [Bacillota bacterium]